MPAPGTELSEREREIVDLVAEGMTNGEIAGALFLSENTIRKHIQRACRRTGTRGRCHLLAVTLRSELLSPPVAPAHWSALLERERALRESAEKETAAARAARDAYRKKFVRLSEDVMRLRMDLVEGEK